VIESFSPERQHPEQLLNQYLIRVIGEVR